MYIRRRFLFLRNRRFCPVYRLLLLRLLKFGKGYGMLGTLDMCRFFGIGIVLTNIKKVGEAVVELDQFKSILATYTEPLVEVRDSL